MIKTIDIGGKWELFFSKEPQNALPDNYSDSIILPDTLEIIGKDAFGYCSALTEITVPASVKQIDDYAFYNCTALLNVTMKCKEADTQLGKSWYPTNNGLNIDNLNITWE